MTQNPYQQLLMLMNALLSGLCGGAIRDLGGVLRVLLMAHAPPPFIAVRYRKPLPFLGCGVPYCTESGFLLFWQKLVVFVGDFLFCIGAFLVSELILFRFNDGAFRLAVPLLFVGGVLLWSRLISPHIARLTAVFAYALGALFVYMRALILLPFRLFYCALLRLVARPVKHLWSHLIHMRKIRQSEALCRRQLAFAAIGFSDSVNMEATKKTEKK